MPITAEDFAIVDGSVPSRVSARYDAARPFLFEGLEPRFAIKNVRSCFVPMRDGIRLSTDFHIPVGAVLPLPVVLVRTCYGKANSAGVMQDILPEQGFICAVQDVRGRYESEGEFIAGDGRDREDGYDTVEWLASQDWCNGRVGAMGSSYLGETAAKLAAMGHPAHRCGVIMFDGSYAGGNSRNGAYLQGGVTLLRMLFGWFRDHVPKISYGPPSHIDPEQWFSSAYAQNYASEPVAQPAVDVDAQMLTLPVHDMLDRSGAAPSDFGEYMRRSANPADPYWDAQAFLGDDDRFHTPTIHVTGPLERGGSGFDNFRLFRENAQTRLARDHQYLWFTAAPHSRLGLCGQNSRMGARDFGDTSFAYWRTLVDWFGHWLRDDRLDLERWPKIRYFPANRNRWQEADCWPPEDAIETRLYLHSEGDAATSGGHLLEVAPGAAEPEDHFSYDPANPVPSEPPSSDLDLLGGGYADRASIEARPDVLTYTTAPYNHPLEIAGPVTLDLCVSSSAPDTDFSAVLTEVDAEGQSINIIHGIARMRFRNGFDQPELMIPGQIYRVQVDLWHAAIVIPVGHRLRLEITSSHFPVFDRNLNTGGDNYTSTDMLVARNAVHHTDMHRSVLNLMTRPMTNTVPA